MTVVDGVARHDTATRTTPAATTSRLAGLDGLRGVAIAAVLLYHGEVSWMPGGFLGVSMFFTLSGFLITTLLLGEADGNGDGRIGLRAFWSRRIRRLLPASLAALVLCAAYVLFAAGPARRSSFRADGLSALFDVANWRLIIAGDSYANVGTAPSSVQHYWSLAIEEQFYVLLPLVLVIGLWAFGRSRRALTLAAGIGVVVTAALPRVLALSDERVYFGTDTRAPELLVGVVLALVLAPRHDAAALDVTARSGSFERRNGVGVSTAGAVALVLVVVACAMTTRADRWLYQGGLAVFAVITALVIVAALDPSRPVARVLGVAPLRELGRISFGVYLYHWPIMLWLAPPAGESWGWPRLLAAWAITIALAIVSYRFLEMPWRARKGLGARPLVPIAPIAVAVVAVLIVAVSAGGVPVAASFDAKSGTLVTDADALSAPHDLTPVAPAASGATTGTAPGTARDDPLAPLPIRMPSRPLRVMMVGDSTAVALDIPLDQWGEAQHVWRAITHARIGCGIGRGGVRARFTWEETVPPECDNWATDWAKALDEYRPDIVVVSSAFWDATDRKLIGDDTWRAPGDPVYDAFMREEYDQAATVLASTGAAVAWLDAPPVHYGYDTPHPEQYGSNDPARMVRLNEILADVVPSHPAVRVIPYTAFLESQPGGVFDTNIRPDGMHAFGASADLAAVWLGPHILDAYWSVHEQAPAR